MENKKYPVKKSVMELMCVDAYLKAISKVKYDQIKHSIVPIKQRPSPLISWEYFMQGYSQIVENIKMSNDLEALKSLSLEHKWLEDPAEFLTQSYESIVLTDSDLVIEWVNPGFFEMTGYSTKYALGKTPRFLQGENTSPAARKRIRRHIKSNKPFKESIINYRKNGEEYTCELTVYPLLSNSGEPCHFLALEKEIV